MTHDRRDPREIWGDQASEVDAEEVLAGLPEGGSPGPPDEEPRRTFLFPLRVVGRFVKKKGRRIGVAIAGFSLILVGAALLVLPGPGWLLIFAGLAVLATEYVWAQRLLNTAKRKAQEAKDKVLGKKKDRTPENDG